MTVFLITLAVLAYMAIGGAIYAIAKIHDSKKPWVEQNFDDDGFLLPFVMAWPFIIVLMIPVAIARVMQIVITLIYAVITSIIYGGEDKG